MQRTSAPSPAPSTVLRAFVAAPPGTAGDGEEGEAGNRRLGCKRTHSGGCAETTCELVDRVRYRHGDSGQT